MIDISISQKSMDIDMRGHAQAGMSGKDIVCAAASMVISTLVYSCKKLLANDGLSAMDYDLDLGCGHVHLTPAKGREMEAKIRFRMAVDGLELLEGTYGEYVRIVDADETVLQ